MRCVVVAVDPLNRPICSPTAPADAFEDEIYARRVIMKMARR
jgi:hypothetical protein